MPESTQATQTHKSEGMQPGPQHQTLARFAGSWRAEVQIWMQPGAGPNVSNGTMTNTLVLGGRFLQQDYQDDAGMFSGKGFWGYNDADKRYEGFWIDTMANFFHIEYGQHRQADDTYVMEGSITNPSTGQPLKKRSVIVYKGPNEHTLDMSFIENQKEFRCMSIRYTR